MKQLLFSAIWMGGLAAAGVVTGQDAKTSPRRPEPCYVVIAVDVSETMENSDGAANPTRREAPGRASAQGMTLRDEGQLIFLQLLPYLRSDLHLGVVHFADRVRYALPSRETGPLLPWGQTFLSESACRNLVKPAELVEMSRPEVAGSLSWALERVGAARQQYGPGPAKLILLSNGDPRDSAREMERGRGSLLSAAKQLAEQQIQIYPILIDEAFLRSGTGPARQSSGARAVGQLMDSIAQMTGGKAYRLAQDLGFADILMDVFDLGAQIPGDVVVSQHDWAIVAIGSRLASLAVQTPGGAGPRKLALDDRLEAAAGIRSSIIRSTGYRATILRRPGTQDLVDRFWQGRWHLDMAPEEGAPNAKDRVWEPQAQSALRLYRIPDCLVQLEMTPALPWWRNEQVQVKARLLDRHQEAPESSLASLSESGRGLSIHLQARSADATGSFAVDQGRWTIPGQAYETEPFLVRTPGLYKLTGELRHMVGDVNTPVLHFTSDLYVHPACVGLEVVNAATNEVLQEVPPTAARLWINLQGGQEVYLRAAGRGEFKAEPMSGIVHLEPLPQTQWTLRKEDSGSLIAGPIALAEQEERLTGSADLEVRTFAGVRHLRLPAFELSYTPAPLRVACTFADPRDALWVGELHRQPLTISAAPVFERFLNQTLGLFPETLAGIHIRTIDLRSGTTQVVDPDNRRLERPQPGGSGGRTVAATYFVESTVPIPPADKCEIDLSGVVENLQGAVKTYAVVDPAAKGLFEWLVQQGGSGPRRGPVSETLFCGEPVLFFASWRPDQNVSAVRFEIPQPDSTESLFVDMPMTPGANKTQLEQVVSGLPSGQVLPLYVHVTMRPEKAQRPLQIKLKGGQFRADDRRLVLEDLTVGDGTLADLSCYLWEPVEVPVRATFRGYKPEDPAHHAALEQFKKSCVVTVSARGENAKDITDTMEWTAMTPVGGPAQAGTLTGHFTCTPEILGRAALEFRGEAPSVRGAAGPSAQRAYVHVLAKEPRLTIAVSRLNPSGAELVFDSRHWIKDPNAMAPWTTRLSARLRVDVQSTDGPGTEQSPPWKATVRLLRRTGAEAPWIIASSGAGELRANQSMTHEVQISDNGQYALEVVMQDPQSHRPAAHVWTPIIASLQPHEVKATIAPPTWLTARVRQWPFEYLVTLHQDSVDLSRAQALAFQFQLPGPSETWLDGATAPVGAPTAETCQLSVKAPRLLPASSGLHHGVARFRLASQGLEVLRWECPTVRVVPPVLESLVLSREAAGPALAGEGGAWTVDGSADVWVRPQLRAAPELEGQWAAAETVIYWWRTSPEDPATGPADVRVLERLQEQGDSGTSGSDITIHQVENNAGVQAVNVLPRRAGQGFWGWPKRAVSEQYSLVAAVVYRPQPEDRGRRAEDRVREMTSSSVISPPSSGFAALPAVVEWSDIYPVHLNAPWVIPLCWWPVAAALLLAVVAMVLRVLVPSPSRLALDMRLEDNVAVVEPVRLDNPVLIDLRETSLAQDLVLYARYLCGRWGTAGRDLIRQAGLRSDSTLGTLVGRLLEGVALLVAPIRVLLRRGLYPRRWAWAAVVPRVRGNTALERTGLLCVWTGLGARRGRVWSSQAGSLALPEEGQTRSINLDLPYRIDSVDRTMRVTVRVRRMGAEEVRTMAAN